MYKIKTVYNNEKHQGNTLQHLILFFDTYKQVIIVTTFTHEFIENLEKMFFMYYMHSYVQISHTGVSPVFN